MSRLHSLLAVMFAGLAALPAGHAQAPKAIVIKAPDGAQVASESTAVIEVHEAGTNKLLWKAELSHLQVSIVLPGGGGTSCHARGPNTVNVPRGPGIVQVLAYTPDGKRLASADSSGVILFDAPTGVFVWSVLTPPGVNGLRFSDDGKELTAKGSNAIAMVFDVATGKRLK
jgi:WD40 repeat protein